MTGACLIVDDSALVRESLRRVLVRGGLFDEVLVAPDGGEALKILVRDEARRIELVLCDLVMPEVDGFDLLERIVDDPDLEDVPVIVLTGEDEVDTKVRALEAGAADFLTKPCHDAELLARVKVHHKMKLLRDELRRANEKLRELAIRDPLTGLFNRRHWQHLMLLEIDRCRHRERPLAVLMVDIDHFKAVNDRFGHVVGDRVLTAAARRLEGELRTHDSIARFGGEEFAVLLPDTGVAAAQTVAERLRLAIRYLRLPDIDGLEVRVSIGVAAGIALGDEEVDTLVAAADEALYQAKRAGRNRIIVAAELAGSAAQ